MKLSRALSCGPSGRPCRIRLQRVGNSCAFETEYAQQQHLNHSVTLFVERNENGLYKNAEQVRPPCWNPPSKAAGA